MFISPEREKYLYVVGPVWCKNHIEVKLMAKPRKPLAVATTQNIASFVKSLPESKNTMYILP